MAAYCPPYQPHSKIDLDESVLRPLKRQHKKEEPMKKGFPESAVTSMGESILGPLHHTSKKGNISGMEKNSSFPLQARWDGNKSLNLTEFNESILGPLAHGREFGNTKNNPLTSGTVAADKIINHTNGNEKTTRRLEEVAAAENHFSRDLDNTLYCESIIGPILKGKDEKSLHQRNSGGNEETIRPHGGKPSRGSPSKFEMMMKKLEGPPCHGKVGGHPPAVPSVSDVESEGLKQQQCRPGGERGMACVLY